MQYYKPTRDILNGISGDIQNKKGYYCFRRLMLIDCTVFLKASELLQQNGSAEQIKAAIQTLTFYKVFARNSFECFIFTITFVTVHIRSLKILTSPDFAHQRCAPL